MKRWAGIVLVLTATCSDNTTQIIGFPGPSWALVWSDEFEGAVGTPVNASTWSYDLGDGCQAGICGWGNNEKEYYTASSENVASPPHWIPTSRR